METEQSSPAQSKNKSPACLRTASCARFHGSRIETTMPDWYRRSTSRHFTIPPYQPTSRTELPRELLRPSPAGSKPWHRNCNRPSSTRAGQLWSKSVHDARSRNKSVHDGARRPPYPGCLKQSTQTGKPPANLQPAPGRIPRLPPLFPHRLAHFSPHPSPPSSRCDEPQQQQNRPLPS